jgi:hypothetical protein
MTFQLSVRRHDSHLCSVAFCPDGLYIKIAHNAYEYSDVAHRVQTWDSSRAQMVECQTYLHKMCTLHDPIIVTPDGWIVHVATQAVISKLPSMVSVESYTASHGSISFTTRVQQETMFTMHFPPTMLTSPETWDPADYEMEDWDSGMDTNSDEEGEECSSLRDSIDHEEGEMSSID